MENIRLNRTSLEIVKNQERIKLTRKEFQLLEFLFLNKNRVVNRLSILEYLWDFDVTVQTNTLEVHIASLRKKLALKLRQGFIKTIHGLGYMFTDSSSIPEPH
jgi:DNA-binding response OmpR family regulator